MTDVGLETEFDDPTVADSPSEPPPLPLETNQLQALEDEKAEEKPVVPVRGVDFHVVDELPAFVSLSLARLKDKTVADEQKASIVNDVILYAVVPDERIDFAGLLRDSEPVIGMTELMEILKDLVEAVLKDRSE